MDFVSARLTGGRWFRTLTVLDLYTRESLALVADRSLTGVKVAAALRMVLQRRRAPNAITSTAMSSRRWPKRRSSTPDVKITVPSARTAPCRIGRRPRWALCPRGTMRQAVALRSRALVAETWWQESVGTGIPLATFDQPLSEAAPKAGARAWPDMLPGRDPMRHAARERGVADPWLGLEEIACLDELRDALTDFVSNPANDIDPLSLGVLDRPIVPFRTRNDGA